MLIGNKQVPGFGLFGSDSVQIVMNAAAANAAVSGLLQSGQGLLRLKVRKIQVLGQRLNDLRSGISFESDGQVAAGQRGKDISQRMASGKAPIFVQAPPQSQVRSGQDQGGGIGGPKPILAELRRGKGLPGQAVLSP